MTGFSLPATQAVNQAVFSDALGAGAWLAAQPQANISAMLSAFETQIGALNRYSMSARERFKTMEVLRKAVFAVSNDCQRRFENKGLPLLGTEQTVFDAVQRLWRVCATAYQHCLNACLANDPGLSSHAPKVAHRVFFCLRMEQLTSYAAGAEIGPGFWSNLHISFLAAAKLGLTATAVEDRLLAETSESTINGQYAMALLLHLARPYSFSGGQFAAIVRWLARWREQATIKGEAPSEKHFVSIDLSQDRPYLDAGAQAQRARWFVMDSVLRKIRHRIEALKAGESPESLKLGSSFPPATCTMLLETLGHNLRHPQGLPVVPDSPTDVMEVGIGLADIHRLLGGQIVEDPLNPSADNYLSKEQLAVFGHVVREAQAGPEAKLERWLRVGNEQENWILLRDAGGSPRLFWHTPLAVRRPEGVRAAVIVSACQRKDGKSCVTVRPLPGDASPYLVEIRDKKTSKVSRHPALQIADWENAGQSLLLLSSGLIARASMVRFLDSNGDSLPELRLAECVDHCGEIDFWRVKSGN